MTDDWGDLTFFDDNYTCDVCSSTEVVPPIGSTNSSILIVGAFPGKDEIKSGKPMVGSMGGVLRTELAMLGFDIKRARRTNLWQHPPNKKEECLNKGMEEVIKEANKKQVILLLGKDPVKVFLNHSVRNTNGLIMQSTYFSAKIVIPCFNPAILFERGSGVGEVRFALTNFVEAVKDIGYE